MNATKMKMSMKMKMSLAYSWAIMLVQKSHPLCSMIIKLIQIIMLIINFYMCQQFYDSSVEDGFTYA